MAFYNIASAEDGELGGHYDLVPGGSDTIVAAPGGFPGDYAYKIDPVNGAVLTELYGFSASLSQPTKTDLLLIPFMYKFDANFDESVSIAELSGVGGLVRRLTMTNLQNLQILDADENTIDETIVLYVSAGDVYWMLWLVDLRSSTHDALWVYRPAVSFVSAGVIFADADPDTMGMVAAEAGRFIIGDEITVAGSASNNGTYTIANRALNMITLAGDEALTNEGPVGATLSTPARWDKALDESGHGNTGGAAAALTFGTNQGKGLPTTGGPFYIKEGVVQTLNETPNDTPLGSITTRYKVANGVNSTGDDDFDAGAGAANPSHLNVDDIPHDGATTYDQGDTQGDRQSYAVEDKDTDAPLALQVVGAAIQGAALEQNVTIQAYIWDGSARDYSEARVIGLDYFGLAINSTYNDINGTDVPDVDFNALEVGIEITSLGGTSTLCLTQIGIEYLVEGPKALPDDFPEIIIGVGGDRRRLLAGFV